MDAAYVFGNMGNLQTALGPGWSSEDAFSWAIDMESELTLTLQGNAGATALRFDLHPAIVPPKFPCQRLIIKAGEIVLGSFEITRRQTLVIPLPSNLTDYADQLKLTLIHPDAIRPCDHLPTDDSRYLTLCFHSASLSQQDGEPTCPAAKRSTLESVHGVIAGGNTARQISEVIGRLPSLKGRFGLRFLDLAQPLDRAVETLPQQTLETMRFCWLQLNEGSSDTRDPLLQRMPAACVVRTFYAPVIHAIWPFQQPDRRAVIEPGRYNPSRYPYGDRLAEALVTLNLPDDLIYLMYEKSVEPADLNLGDLFASDLHRLRAEAHETDMDLANFIEQNISSSRLFIAPDRVGPPLLREMINQVLDNEMVRDIVPANALADELDTLLEGYAGSREEIPVHKRVADFFHLEWWSPDMKYRWQNNMRSHREHILDTIRWVQWRP